MAINTAKHKSLKEALLAAGLSTVPGMLWGFTFAPRDKKLASATAGAGLGIATISPVDWSSGFDALLPIAITALGALGAVGKGIYLGVQKAGEKQGASKKKVNRAALAAGIGIPVLFIGGNMIRGRMEKARKAKLKASDTRAYCEELAQGSSVDADVCICINENQKARDRGVPAASLPSCNPQASNPALLRAALRPRAAT